MARSVSCARTPGPTCSVCSRRRASRCRPGIRWCIIARLAGRTGEELLRRLVRAVLDHQGGGLRDDATLLLVQWTGT
jgi:hypothetical protein